VSVDGYFVREPLRLLEAEAWVIAKLGDTPRAGHSRFVGYLMRGLGERLAPNEAELWEITGLVHDLDYFVVEGHWLMHGRTTAAWLEGRLPLPALLAVAAHDHRSGIVSNAPIADALKLCDALAVLDEAAGRAATLSALRTGEAAIATLAGERAFLGRMIVELSGRLGVALGPLAGLIEVLPEQPRG
jgi:hypothetical protein